MKEGFFGLTLPQLGERVSQAGMPVFTARQLWQWVYQKMQLDSSQWSNISKPGRQQLDRLFSFDLPQVEQKLCDGQGTCKFLLRLSDGQATECVSIPETGHVTFCVSSQVGCPLSCRFCATGRMGFRRQLEVAEIMAQVYLMKSALGPYTGKLNLVFMGMGEPLLNRSNLFAALEIITNPNGLTLAQRNITVSTAGILAGIEDLFEHWPGVKLSLSLNGFDPSSRAAVMPITRTESIEPILNRLRRYRSRNRVTFEYVLLHGVNDSLDQARRLASWLKGISCKINLIPFNPYPGAEFSRPDPAAVDRFAQVLHHHHYTVVVRWSKGGEIAAACGQLAVGAEHGQDPV